MTSGQIYEKNKKFYDDLAKNYISKNLKNINDTCYIPFTMKTCYTRRMIKKIDNNCYLVFDGLVESIEDEGKIYKSDKMNDCKKYNYIELLEMCGFEYSLNPYYRIN